MKVSKSTLNYYIFLCAILMSSLTPLHATEILDQSLDGEISLTQGIGHNPGSSGKPLVAQTFTAGISGYLHSVEIAIQKQRNDQNLIVEIFDVQSGFPGNMLLGSILINESLVPDTRTFLNVDFSSFDIEIASGSEYAIVVYDDDNNNGNTAYSWAGTNQDLYTGGSKYHDVGSGFVKTDTDLYFKTYIESQDAGYDEGYEAGKQYCIDHPEECGLRPAKPDFTGELAEEIQSYLTLTNESVPFYLSPGSYVQAFGSDDINTINVKEFSRLQFKNSIGSNEVNIEEAASQFTVYRSGATVYLNSTSGTHIEIPATETSQTLRFADGSLELEIISGNVMLGNQVVDKTERPIEAAVDTSNTSESIF